MISPLFAMPPADWYRHVPIVLLVVIALALLFLRATASKEGERNRRLRLGLLAFLGGPLLAALLAGLYHAFNHVHPLDVDHLYFSHIAIGIIAGCILGLFFTLSSLLCSNGLESPPRNPNP